MRDPVIAADGHTYDREAIEMWLRNHDTSPKPGNWIRTRSQSQRNSDHRPSPPTGEGGAPEAAPAGTSILTLLSEIRSGSGTGQPMGQLSLVPNLNLGRLIKDLLNEGGEGLYLRRANGDSNDDDSDGGERGGGRARPRGREGSGEYRFALVTEQILVLKCLGPTDSDWNEKSFRVTERGCVGGRKQPALLEGADFMQFSDATVSRRHFEIVYDRDEKQFSLCDFGSAGGTFVRLASGVPTPLYPSMMIMLGKHQLEVTQVPSDQADMMDDADCASIASEDKAAGNGNNACSNRPARAGDPQAAGRRGLAGGGGGAGAGVKEGAATDQEEGGGRRERGRPTSALSSTPSKIGDGLSLLRIGLAGAEGFPGGEAVGGGALLLDNGEQRARQDSSRSPLPHENAAGGEDDASVLDTPLQDKHGDGGDGGSTNDENELEGLEKSFQAGVKLARGHRRVCLECFAPEGTPIQGATLGRRQTNTIAFSHESNGTVMGIDASISGEHARIVYDEEGDFLHIMDGTPTKPSTNGTWFRLSGMHTESRPFPLSSGAEILIGTERGRGEGGKDAARDGAVTRSTTAGIASPPQFIACVGDKGFGDECAS
eukprot:jgi/Undpi1/1624/HiC_scaffold_11.g05014.m1